MKKKEIKNPKKETKTDKVKKQKEVQITKKEKKIDTKEKQDKKSTDKIKRSKKFKIIVGIISSLVIISLCITFVVISSKQKLSKYNEEMDSIREQNKDAIINYKEKIEYKTKWTYDELIKKLIKKSKLSDDTNIKVMVNNKEFKKSSTLEFNKVGNYKIVVYLNRNYSYKILKETTENIEVKKEINLKVEDTIFPVIEGVSDKTITVGDEIDLLSGISANDEVEGKIEVKVEGTVDNKKAGTYKIKVYAEDANGNKTEKEFTVTVNEKTTASSYSSKRSNGSSGSSGNSSGGCSYTGLLQRRGYNSSDPDACEKNNQASAIAYQIARSIGGGSDFDRVSRAAKAVSNYYYRGVHKESGLDYRTPYGVFIKGESSCAGATRALIQVLEAMGYGNLTHANANSWSHQWVILTMDGQIGYADGQVGMVGFGNHPSSQ